METEEDPEESIKINNRKKKKLKSSSSLKSYPQKKVNPKVGLMESPPKASTTQSTPIDSLQADKQQLFIVPSERKDQQIKIISKESMEATDLFVSIHNKIVYI